MLHTALWGSEQVHTARDPPSCSAMKFIYTEDVVVLQILQTLHTNTRALSLHMAGGDLHQFTPRMVFFCVLSCETDTSNGAASIGEIYASAVFSRAHFVESPAGRYGCVRCVGCTLVLTVLWAVFGCVGCVKG